jgi:predicted GH43/DUF377 family glycosyl hydrolase
VTIRVYSCAFAAILLCSCSRYADFTLPPPDQSGPKSPFTWQPNPDPVIPRASATDVLNPSVINFHGQYLNLYSTYDGRTWHTALATSPDGVTWQNRGTILSPEAWEGHYIAANGSALVHHDEILYWYEAGDPFQIAFASSKDGTHWTKRPTPVLLPGPRGSFDERAVADPNVIAAAGSFFMFYTGLDRARRQRLGIARSSDGEHWQKLRSNPILEVGSPNSFDENGLGEPAVWSSAGSYWMLYTGRSKTEQRRIGLAKSEDGVHWTRDPSLPIIEGTSPWDKEVICDPTIEITPQGIRVWFGGGNARSPDQNLNGQIGLGLLHPH